MAMLGCCAPDGDYLAPSCLGAVLQIQQDKRRPGGRDLRRSEAGSGDKERTPDPRTIVTATGTGNSVG